MFCRIFFPSFICKRFHGFRILFTRLPEVRSIAHVCDICDIDNTEGRASRVCQIQECCTRTQKPTAANMTGHVEREMAESSQVNEEKCVEKGYEGKELAD